MKLFENLKMISWVMTLLMTVIINTMSFSQSEHLPKWNGYLQTRLASDFDKSTEFTIRRAKFWVYGKVPKVDYISYKFQMVTVRLKTNRSCSRMLMPIIRFKNYGSLRAGRCARFYAANACNPITKFGTGTG
jgi:hypothetical protein